MNSEWKFEKFDKEFILSKSIVEQAQGYIADWLEYFPKEDTWVQNNYHVPSVIIRLDCVVVNDKLFIYEIEERPSGIGVTIGINQIFAENLIRFRNKWPAFKSVISPLRNYCDDVLWLDPAESSDDLVLVRSEPKEAEFHSYQPKLVSTLLTKGDKSYGERMGLWKKVTINDLGDYSPYWEKGFCLKPLQGSKCQYVEIWHPELKRIKKMFNGGGGVSTKKRIKETLISQEAMYLQDFIEPMAIDDNGMAKRYIYRIFFGYDPETGSYDYMGGFANIRASFKIHGATDTKFAPIN